jgi:thymidylate synthase
MVGPGLLSCLAFEFTTLLINQIRENISEYKVEDFEVHNYKSHEAIKMKMIA